MLFSLNPASIGKFTDREGIGRKKTLLVLSKTSQTFTEMKYCKEACMVIILSIHCECLLWRPCHLSSHHVKESLLPKDGQEFACGVVSGGRRHFAQPKGRE